MSAPPLTNAICNILILGETQSGKSNLIEGIKRYADPTYIIDKKAIGDGNFSCTDKVHTAEVTTSCPPYYILEGHEQTRLDYGRFIETMDKDDYEDAINNREGYELKQGESTRGQAKRTFRLIDTPGLNDTRNFDETHIGSIFKALKGQDIHLVIITVAKNTLSDGVKGAIKCYVDMLPDFKEIIVFVHTHIEYKHRHPEDIRFAKSMTEKMKILDEISGTKNSPHFMIDCDLETTRPIHACMTQDVIRDVLSLAAFNQPVRVSSMTMKKTPKMIEMDRFLEDKYKAVIENRFTTLQQKHEDEAGALDVIRGLNESISAKEKELQDVNDKLSKYNNDELMLEDQRRIDQNWSVFKPVKTGTLDAKSRYFIDHVNVQARNILYGNVQGGKDAKYWSAEYRRKRYQGGFLHVKLFVKKRKIYGDLITQLEVPKRKLPDEICRLKNNLQEYEVKKQDLRTDIEKLLNELSENQYMLSQVSGNDMDVRTFHELVEFGAYKGETLDNLRMAETFFLENRAKLEERVREPSQTFGEPVDISISFDDDGEDIDVQTQ